MKKVIASLLVLVGIQAHAAQEITFAGTTSEGQACSVTLRFDPPFNHVNYSYTKSNGVSDGYGFAMSNEFEQGLKSHTSPLEINSGGTGGATLKVFSTPAGIYAAKYRNMFVINSSCKNMVQTAN